MRPIALHGHSRALTQVMYNADGDLIFSLSKDGVPMVWYSDTGKRLGTFNGHKGSVVWAGDVNFSSTLFATAAADQMTKIYSVPGIAARDVKPGDCLATIPHATPVYCTAFSHGDSKLFTVTDSKYGQKPAINIYDISDIHTGEGLPRDDAAEMYWEERKSVASFDCDVNWAVWGPSNDTIYFGSDDGSISILDVETQREIHNNAGAHSKSVKRIKFDTDYTFLISGSQDTTAKLFDPRTLKTVKTYRNDKPVNEADISSKMDHVLLAGGDDAQSITNLSHRQNKFEAKFFHTILEEELGAMPCHFGPVNTCALHPQGRGFVTGGEDGLIKIHNFDKEYFLSPGNRGSE